MTARARLQEERKAWRREHPHGFVAKPCTNADGSQNILRWQFRIPARASSIWAPGVYSGELVFCDEYPQRPPIARFDKLQGEPLFHPNVYNDGRVCLSIINPPESTHGYGKGGKWSPSFGVKQILLALQRFLDEATGYANGRDEAFKLFNQDKPAYERRVKEQVARAARE